MPSPMAHLYATEEVTIFTEGEHQVSSQIQLAEALEYPSDEDLDILAEAEPWRGVRCGQLRVR